MKLDLYVSEATCFPCKWVKSFIKEHEVNANIVEGGDHPLVYDYPTLIIDGTSAIKGATAIQYYLETHVIPKRIIDEQD